MQLLSETTIDVEAPSPAACARAMLDGLPQVMWFIRRQMRRHRAHGLSVPQFRTLVLLDRYPSASLSAVAENLGSSAPTASRIVSGLVSKGLVTRKNCTEDRRQVALVLTARGRAALTSGRRATQDGLADEIAHLTDAQRATVIDAMRLLHDSFAGTPLPGDADVASAISTVAK